jgi:hypothetical protein
MWLSLEDTYAVMDDHANSVEENVKEFKTLLEPIYRYVLCCIVLYCTVHRLCTLQDYESQAAVLQKFFKLLHFVPWFFNSSLMVLSLP